MLNKTTSQFTPQDQAFIEALSSLPAEQRCIQYLPGAWNLRLNDCYFGVKESNWFGWKSMSSPPISAKAFYFYIGSDHRKIFSTFANSRYPQQIDQLHIGDSCYRLGSGSNYKQVAETLAKANYPNLKEFHFGVWQLFSNSHGLCGKLGDITELISKMPSLIKLCLSGNFELNNPMKLDKLKYLDITLDDITTGMNGGFISQYSLDNILSSHLPNLEEFYLDLDCEDNDMQYEIERTFLNATRVPRLKKFELRGGFKSGTKIALNKSKLKQQLETLHGLNEICES